MSSTRWLSSMRRPLHSKKAARRRHPVNPLSGLQGARRPLPDEQGNSPTPRLKAPIQTTIYVANKAGDSTLGPYTLQNVAAWRGCDLPGRHESETPAPTIGGQFRRSHSRSQTTATTMKPYIHFYIHPIMIRYTILSIKPTTNIDLYIGYENDGKYILGLPYGKTITVIVPLVFWNGGRADIATDGPHLLPKPSQVNDLNPYQFRYTASTYITTQGVSSSTDDGILMYYKANTVNAPNDPSPAAAGQLTEWTIRDQAFLTKVNQYDQDQKLGTIPASELTTLVNYDVSYVDDMTSPVAMKALQVPIPIAYVQNGTATTQGGTTTITLPTNPAPAPAFLQLLTQTYPYGTNQWQVRYDVPGSTTSIAVGTITNISNGTITVVNSGPVSGLPTNLASFNFYTNSVTQDYGWTGANNDIVQMQGAMLDFTSDNTKAQPNINGLGQFFGGLGWPKYYNPDPTALLKIPSGASVLINSPLLVKTSPYEIHHYLLTSGNEGNQFFYNANQQLVPKNQPTNAGDTVTLHVGGANLAAIKKQGGTWVLSQDPNTAGANLIGTIVDKSINLANSTVNVKLAQTIPDINGAPGGYSYLIVAPPTDPYTTKLTNLWYSWANYYVSQFSGKTAPGTISATLSADTDSTTDTRILTPSSTPAAPFEVGMTVTGNGITALTTILKIVGNQLYLSAPWRLQRGNSTSSTFRILKRSLSVMTRVSTRIC